MTLGDSIETLLTGKRSSEQRKARKKIQTRKSQFKTYHVVSDNDGNETFEVKAKTPAHAAYEALTILGWFIAVSEQE